MLRDAILFAGGILKTYKYLMGRAAKNKLNDAPNKAKKASTIKKMNSKSKN